MELLRSRIREIPDFPSAGISYKDITPLLADKDAFRLAVDSMASQLSGRGIQHLIGIESRGFIFGSALAYAMGVGLILVRKPHKLPSRTTKIEYALEYGNDTLEIHEDAVPAGERVIIVDDILATGGTARATAGLVEKVGGRVEALVFLAELALLNGRDKLLPYEVITLMSL